MSIFEEKGCITYKNKNGDIYRLYPETKKECITGMEEIDDHLVNYDNPHNISVEQIGAIPISDIITIEEMCEYLGIIQDNVENDTANNPIIIASMMQGDSFSIFFIIPSTGVDNIIQENVDDVEVCVDTGGSSTIRKMMSDGSVRYDEEKQKWSFRLDQEETLSMTPGAIYNVDARVKSGDDVRGFSVGRIIIQDAISEQVI